jgi:hypothetical protein
MARSERGSARRRDLHQLRADQQAAADRRGNTRVETVYRIDAGEETSFAISFRRSRIRGRRARFSDDPPSERSRCNLFDIGARIMLTAHRD